MMFSRTCGHEGPMMQRIAGSIPVQAIEREISAASRKAGEIVHS